MAFGIDDSENENKIEIEAEYKNYNLEQSYNLKMNFIGRKLTLREMKIVANSFANYLFLFNDKDAMCNAGV